MSVSGFKNIVTDGLVFEIDAANKISDNISNSRDFVPPFTLGTFINGASVSNDLYVLDGVDDRIDFSNAAASKLDASSTGTIEMFIRPTALVDGDRWLCLGRTSAQGSDLQIYGRVDGRLFIYLVTSTPSVSTKWEIRTTLADPFDTSQFWHFCLVQDGIRPRVYRNGVEIVVTDQIANDLTQWVDKATFINNFTIGARKHNTTITLYQAMELGYIRAYTKALSVDEINQNYDAMKYRYQ